MLSGRDTQKICVLGNSHVGALRRAWTSLEPQFKSFKITFFAARGSRLNDLRVHGGLLAPSTRALENSLRFTSGGHGRINPKKFDLVLVYGLGLRAFVPARLSDYSSAVLLQSMEDFASTTLCVRVLKQFREISEIPAFVGHSPLEAARDPRNSGSSAPDYRAGVDVMRRWLWQRFRAELVAQPEELLDERGLTPSHFSQGSAKLAVGLSNDNELHGVEDISHMNEAFGEIWLQNFLERVR